MTPGELLKQARRRHGVSQGGLAIRAGTTQSAISRIERDRVSPRSRRCASCSTCLGEDLALSSERARLRASTGRSTNRTWPSLLTQRVETRHGICGLRTPQSGRKRPPGDLGGHDLGRSRTFTPSRRALAGARSPRRRLHRHRGHGRAGPRLRPIPPTTSTSSMPATRPISSGWPRRCMEIGVALRGAPADLPFTPDARTLENGANFTFDTEWGSFDILGRRGRHA